MKNIKYWQVMIAVCFSKGYYPKHINMLTISLLQVPQAISY